jgi:hypothetical protein
MVRQRKSINCFEPCNPVCGKPVYTGIINLMNMKKQAFFLVLALLLSVSFIQAQTRETRTVGTFTKIAFRLPGKLLLRQGDVQKVEIEGKQDILKEIETEVEGSRLVIGKESQWKNFNWKDDDRITVYITVKNLDAISVSGSGDVIGETKFTTGDLELNVSGSGSLKIEVDATGEIEGDVSGSGDIVLKGKCKNFDSDISGSGKVNIALSITDVANFELSGSGKVEASGTANTVKASISGSGKVLAANLEVNRCEIRIAGSGDVEVNVKNEIDANITGSGSVNYKGNPSKINSHSSGSGKIHKM